MENIYFNMHGKFNLLNFYLKIIFYIKTHRRWNESKNEGKKKSGYDGVKRKL